MSGNQQLQVRAGKNYPPFLFIENANLTGKKITQADTLLVVGPEEKGSLVTAGSSSFFGSIDAVTVFNDTGAPLSVALVFVDPFGSELVVDTAAAIASGTSASMNASDLMGQLLGGGEKVLLRVTAGSFSAGSGAHYIAVAQSLVESFATSLRGKVESSVLAFAAPPGASSFAAVFGVVNFSSVPLTYNAFTVLADGYVVPDPSNPYVLPPGAEVDANPSAVSSPDISYRIVFSALPPAAAGYLYYMFVLENLLNAFDPTAP